jgi:hypothetical protein
MQSGDTVTVSVKTNQEITFYNFSLKLEADPAFTLTAISQGADYSDFGFGAPTSNPATGIAVMSPAAASNDNKTVGAGKEVLTFTYSGANAAAANDYAFNLTVNAAADVNGDNLSWNKSTASATLTIAAAAPVTDKDYTVTLSADKEEVAVDGDLNVYLDVSSNKEGVNSFNAFYARLSYNTANLTYTGYSPTEDEGLAVNTTAEPGVLMISRQGTDASIDADAHELTLKFKGKEKGTAEFTLSGVKVDVAANAEKDAPAADFSTEPLSVNVVEAISPTVVSGGAVSEYTVGEAYTLIKVEVKDLQEGQKVTYNGADMVECGGFYYIALLNPADGYSDTKVDFVSGTNSSLSITPRSMDINESKLVDINDAQFVYNILNGAKPSENVTQRLLLADANGNGKVQTDDCSTVVSAINAQA